MSLFEASCSITASVNVSQPLFWWLFASPSRTVMHVLRRRTPCRAQHSKFPWLVLITLLAGSAYSKLFIETSQIVQLIATDVEKVPGVINNVIEPSALGSCSAMKEGLGPPCLLRNTGHAPVQPHDKDPGRLWQPAVKKQRLIIMHDLTQIFLLSDLSI